MKNLMGWIFSKLETRNSKLDRALVIACLATIFLMTADAQVATGTPPFGSFAGGPDVINLSNLNIHWAFRVISKAGRGIPVTYAISFDNSVWKTVDDGNGHLVWQPVDVNTMGWTRQTEVLSGYMTYEARTFSCGTIYVNWVYHDPAGTAHPISQSNVGAAACGYPFSSQGWAGDDSGIQAVTDASPGATVYLPSGTSIRAPVQNATGATRITDTNGNFISSADGVTFTDTLGKNVLNITNSGGGTAFPTGYHYQGPNGDTQVWLSYTPYNIQTNFACSGIIEYGPTQIWLLTAIHYPDGSSYALEYEDTPGIAGSKTGRLKKVTLPTGGSISYSYYGAGVGCGSNVGINSDGMTAAFTRTANDGASDSISTFWLTDRGGTSNGTTHASVYTSPSQYDETVLNFSGGFETQRQIYQGPAPPTSGGTLLKTVLTCYNSNFTDCANATVGAPINRKIFYDIFPSGLWDAHDRFFNINGLLTEADDYDFVIGSFGGPTRRELTTYASNLGRIIDRPASVIVEDGANPPHILEQTNYVYDDYSVHGLVLTDSYTPPMPQHGSPPQSQRGNLTSVSRLVAGSTFLTAQFTYFDTGVLSTTIDVNGAVTTYNYPINDPNNTTCGFSFPNSVSAPTVGGIALTTATTWNCDGGVARSTTDPNGNSKSVATWDPNYWRPTVMQDELGFVTNTVYTSPTVTETSFNFNNGNSTVYTRTTLDGLGRTHISQRRQSPTSSNYDSVETDYDSYGFPKRQTTAYVGTAGQTNATAPATTTTYDALGRPKLVTDAGGGTINYTYTDNNIFMELGPLATGDSNTKRRQYQYDALGRLTFVCELATDPANGTCGLTPAYWGFQTHYTYDAAGRLTQVAQNTQQGAPGSQQTRSFSYDNLGRMLSESNPETGTTNYTYDSGGGCGTTFTGDLVAKSDANTNLICNYFDALHRLTQVLHFGPAQATTANAVYIYDAATVNGQTMQNAKGRLAEAYTCMPGCFSATSILGFSYSARGETSDAYESTTHSGGYYHVTADYWAHGALKNWTMPGVPTITYGATDGSGLDGEGRITKVNAATGINPVNSVSYNNVDPGTSNQPLGALLSVNFGTTTTGQYDTDSFSYNKNTGRLTQYTTNVNGGLNTGTLAWNANGSLRQLQIATSSISDFQTCNYTHDDLGRIANVNCSEGNPLGMFFPWAQNFSFDPFGNITKTVPQGGTGTAFQVSYNQANNRINSTGYSYDNNGNLTTDATGIHTYQWDAEGNPRCIDGVVISYDAMGRAVEQAIGGTCASPGTNYKQIVYGPDGGKLALMNAQTLIKVFVPLPGGATAVYDSSGLAYYRHSNHLGSSVLASTPARTVYSATSYAPFGENYNGAGTTDLSFTGQNQDTVTGLYDFMFRRHSPNQGRWISPDPAGMAAVKLTDPQSWNRYAYVMNRALTNLDPLGLEEASRCLIDANTGECSANGYGFGGGGCSVDGMALDCGWVLGMLLGDAAVQCPNNMCEVGLTKFWAFVGGGSGYYAFYGPGSLNYSMKQAGLAASNYLRGYAYPKGKQPSMHEFASNVYKDANGMFSFSVAQEGPLCEPEKDCRWDINFGTPDYTDLVGSAHTHPPRGYGDTTFSETVDIATYLSFKTPLYGFVVTPPGDRVLMFDPVGYYSFMNNNGGHPTCVLQGELQNITRCR